MSTTPRNSTHNLPLHGEYDIVVCGGGLAGCGAAIQAARQAARVLLVERLEVLGGLGSAGCVGNFCAAEGGLAGQGRVFDDILAGLRAYSAIGEENGWMIRRNKTYRRENWTFDHRFLPLVLQEMALAAGVDILYATDIVGANVENGRIQQAVLHNRSLMQTVRAAVFIDTTGDGILARHAGGEALPDDPQLPGVIKPSNMMFMRQTDRPAARPEVEPVGTDGVQPDYSVWPDIPGHLALKMKLFHRKLDTGSGQGYSDAVIAMRREEPRFAEHFRQRQGASHVFAGAAPMLGLRESQRIRGDCVLTIADCRAGRRFADAVAYGTFTVDANETAEILPPYQIPLRSLLVWGVDNCLVAGRCFSADRLALSSARTMATCCLMGQAAGTAAALTARADDSLRAVDPALVRQSLIAAADKNQTMTKYLEE